MAAVAPLGGEPVDVREIVAALGAARVFMGKWATNNVSDVLRQTSDFRKNEDAMWSLVQHGPGGAFARVLEAELELPDAPVPTGDGVP